MPFMKKSEILNNLKLPSSWDDNMFVNKIEIGDIWKYKYPYDFVYHYLILDVSKDNVMSYRLETQTFATIGSLSFNIERNRWSKC